MIRPPQLTSSQLRESMPKILLLAFAIVLTGCGKTSGNAAATSTPTSNPTPTPAPTPATLNICEASVCPWEIEINTGTLIQANLTIAQGTVLVDGQTYSLAPLGGWPQLYASGTPGVGPANQYQSLDLTGSLTGTAITMQYIWTNDPNPSGWQFNLVGTLDTTNSTVSGNASFGTAASGTFIGAQRTSGLPISYSGTLATFANSCLESPGGQNCPPQGSDNVQVSFAMDGSFNITATLTATGSDNGTYSLSGPMTGNAMQLSGILGNQEVELVAYYDVKGVYGGSAQSLIVFQNSYPISTQQKGTSTYGYSGTLNPSS